MCWFLTSIFSCFGLDLEPLGLPRWSQVGSKSKEIWSGCGLGSLLKFMSLKNDILEGSGLDFGSPGPRFGRSEAQFSRFAHVFGRVPRTCRDLAQLVDRNLDARLHWTPHSQPLKVHACIPMDAAVSA